MQKSLTSEGLYLLDTNWTALPVSLVIHNNFADRMALCRRRFIQISALSTSMVG